ncbi:hypothetical protein PG994_014033 [Apiospora phragmitis]|uniref:Uncharacterized protein n=1 Tax=Apiospora phragmitis TaxID=2905665 RepID=A0ABR1T355_9PEZI
MINDEEQLWVAVHLGQLATDTASTTDTTATTTTTMGGGGGGNTLSALNLVQVSVAMHLIRAGKNYVTRIAEDKDKDKDESNSAAAEKRRLAGGLGAMVGTWLRSEDEMVRDLALEWKREHRELVAVLEKEAALGGLLRARETSGTRKE